MLQVRLLGQFKVEVSGTPVNIPSRPAQSLLAYLILNAGIALRREKLAGLLWPDSSDSNARSNLRHALWRIRKAFETSQQHGRDHITADDLTITFAVTADDWLDVAILEGKIGEQATADELIRVVSLYQGELLPGFYDEWVLLERERLQAVFEQKMQLLLDRLVFGQRWPEVLEWGERWIALGQTPEPAYRTLMIAHNELGDHSNVGAAYQRCVESLRQELGVEPSEQTQELYQRLLRGEAPAGAPSSGPVAPARIKAIAPDLPFGHPHPGLRAPFVARESELAQLDRFLGMALAGQGRVAFVTGEAGSGKTALVQEFAWRAQQREADLVVAGGNCNAYTGIGDPYLPFREIMGLLTGDLEAWRLTELIDGEHTCRLWNLVPEAVQALVNAGPDLIDIFIPGRALSSRAARVASEYGATPGAARWLDQLEKLMARKEADHGRTTPHQHALFEQYTRVLLTLADQKSLLLVLDDLQWADVGSISLLFHLGRRVDASRILIVGIYRPAEVALGRPVTVPSSGVAGARERHPLKPVISELQRRFGPMQIDLRQAGGKKFVEQLLDTEPNRLGPSFRAALFQHTRGHALFTVEMLRGMQERGDLRLDDQGRWVEGPYLDWDSLPARIEGVIEKRVSRLDSDLREALTVASVEGEAFTAEVVAGVRAVEDRELVRRLSGELDKRHRLIRAEGVRRLGPSGQRLSMYRFRHHLFQKYLFHRLDDVERCYLHEAVGNALEQLYGEQTEEAAVQLARHFLAAGIPEKAVGYLRQAGERAVRLSANEEAVAHFTKALALLETQPDILKHSQQELALQIALGVPLIITKGYGTPEVAQAYTRAWELCQHLEDTPYHFPALRGLWNCYLERMELQQARELAEQLFSLAKNAQDRAHLLEANRALGTTLFFLGEFPAAQTHLEQGIALYDQREHRALAFLYGADPGLVCRHVGALTLWHLGYPDRARQQMDETLILARELSHLHSLAFALINAAWLDEECGARQAAQERAEAAITLSTEQGFPFWLAEGTVQQGWALVEQDQTEAGIALMRQGLADYRSIGTVVAQSRYLALLARAYEKAGQIDAGLEALVEALPAANKNREQFYEAEIYRLKGELLLKADGGGRNASPEMSPEACFLKAIEMARAQQAKSLELRAIVSLARLWQSERSPGKIKEVRQLLEDIYNWFTEGFDTADLKEAELLLKQLR